MSLRWLAMPGNTGLVRGALVATLLLTGCFGKRAAPDGVEEDSSTRLSESVSVDVKEWLSKPRSELAKLCDEAEDAAKKRAAALRDGKAPKALLPMFRVAVQAPVFRDAEFRNKLG